MKTSDHDLVSICHNLQELYDGLKNNGVDAVIFHMRNGNNDFAEWVSEVIGDQVLARSLRNSKSQDWVRMRKSLMQKIKRRIESISK
jgi:hypothetical protein